MKLIKELVLIYKLLFRAFTPIVIGALPVIPYIITNNGTWMFALFLTIPLSTVIALKYWDFQEETETETNTEQTKTKELNIKI